MLFSKEYEKGYALVLEILYYETKEKSLKQKPSFNHVYR